MKKHYIVPSLEILDDIESEIICASTIPDDNRRNDLGIDPVVRETDDDTWDPNNGHGRGDDGDGGSGGRAKPGSGIGFPSWGRGSFEEL